MSSLPPFEAPAAGGMELHSFEFDGHTYTIRKRAESPFWQLRFWLANERRNFSTKTTFKGEAVARSKEFIRAQFAALYNPQPEAAKASATIGEVWGVFERVSKGRVKERTATDYLGCLHRVVRRAANREEMTVEQLMAVSTDSLSGKTVRDFEAWMLATASTPEERELAKVTTGRTLAQARALFGREWRQDYEDAGLVLSDLKDFMERAVKQGIKRQHLPPTAEDLQAIKAGLPEFERADPAAAMAVRLAIYLGLRAAEIGRVQWAWLSPEAFRVPPGWTKNREAAELPMQTELWEALERFKAAVPVRADGYVLPSSLEDGAAGRLRAQAVLVRARKWVKERMGTEDRFHKLHALRKFAIDQVAGAYGMQAAKAFARHATPGLTEKTYTRPTDIGSVKVGL